MEGQGTQYNWEDLVPGASGQTFTITQYQRAMVCRTPGADGADARAELAYFWPGTTAQIQGIDGAIGYNVAANGTASRIGDVAANDRRTELLRHPVPALRIALDPASGSAIFGRRP